MRATEAYIEWLRAEGRRRELPPDSVTACAEYAARLLDRGLAVVFDDTHLALHLEIAPAQLWSFVHASNSHYREFRIRKASGGYRTIHAPKPSLRKCQRWVLDEILANVAVPDSCTGFVRGRSIRHNARPHVGHECVVNMDMKDFFPSIKWTRVRKLFRDLGYSRRVSFILSHMCTHRGRLPQGAPSSPAIANLVARGLDARLDGLAQSTNTHYSRYADDLTFSGDGQTATLIPLVGKIVKDEGFRVNRRKTRVMRRGQPQVVTGLSVNTKVSIPKKARRKIRQIVHHCERWGEAAHRERVGDDRANLRDHLYGWAYYNMGIHREQGTKLLKALDRV